MKRSRERSSGYPTSDDEADNDAGSEQPEEEMAAPSAAGDFSGEQARLFEAELSDESGSGENASEEPSNENEGDDAPPSEDAMDVEERKAENGAKKKGQRRSSRVLRSSTKGSEGSDDKSKKKRKKKKLVDVPMPVIETPAMEAERIERINAEVNNVQRENEHGDNLVFGVNRTPFNGFCPAYPIQGKPIVFDVLNNESLKREATKFGDFIGTPSAMARKRLLFLLLRTCMLATMGQFDDVIVEDEDEDEEAEDEDAPKNKNKAPRPNAGMFFCEAARMYIPICSMIFEDIVGVEGTWKKLGFRVMFFVHKPGLDANIMVEKVIAENLVEYDKFNARRSSRGTFDKSDSPMCYRSIRSPLALARDILHYLPQPNSLSTSLKRIDPQVVSMSTYRLSHPNHPGRLTDYVNITCACSYMKLESLNVMISQRDETSYFPRNDSLNHRVCRVVMRAAAFYFAANELDVNTFHDTAFFTSPRQRSLYAHQNEDGMRPDFTFDDIDMEEQQQAPELLVNDAEQIKREKSLIHEIRYNNIREVETLRAKCVDMTPHERNKVMEEKYLSLCASALEEFKRPENASRLPQPLLVAMRFVENLQNRGRPTAHFIDDEKISSDANAIIRIFQYMTSATHLRFGAVQRFVLLFWLSGLSASWFVDGLRPHMLQEGAAATGKSAVTNAALEFFLPGTKMTSGYDTKKALAGAAFYMQMIFCQDEVNAEGLGLNENNLAQETGEAASLKMMLTNGGFLPITETQMNVEKEKGTNKEKKKRTTEYSLSIWSGVFWKNTNLNLLTGNEIPAILSRFLTIRGDPRHLKEISVMEAAMSNISRPNDPTLTDKKTFFHMIQAYTIIFNSLVGAYALPEVNVDAATDFCTKLEEHLNLIDISKFGTRPGEAFAGLARSAAVATSIWLQLMSEISVPYRTDANGNVRHFDGSDYLRVWRTAYVRSEHCSVVATLMEPNLTPVTTEIVLDAARKCMRNRKVEYLLRNRTGMPPVQDIEYVLLDNTGSKRFATHVSTLFPEIDQRLVSAAIMNMKTFMHRPDPSAQGKPYLLETHDGGYKLYILEVLVHDEITRGAEKPNFKEVRDAVKDLYEAVASFGKELTTEDTVRLALSRFERALSAVKHFISSDTGTSKPADGAAPGNQVSVSFAPSGNLSVPQIIHQVAQIRRGDVTLSLLNRCLESISDFMAQTFDPAAVLVESSIGSTTNTSAGPSETVMDGIMFRMGNARSIIEKFLQQLYSTRYARDRRMISLSPTGDPKNASVYFQRFMKVFRIKPTPVDLVRCDKLAPTPFDNFLELNDFMHSRGTVTTVTDEIVDMDPDHFYALRHATNGALRLTPDMDLLRVRRLAQDYRRRCPNMFGHLHTLETYPEPLINMMMAMTIGEATEKDKEAHLYAAPPRKTRNASDSLDTWDPREQLQEKICFDGMLEDKKKGTAVVKQMRAINGFLGLASGVASTPAITAPPPAQKRPNGNHHFRLIPVPGHSDVEVVQALPQEPAELDPFDLF